MNYILSVHFFETSALSREIAVSDTKKSGKLSFRLLRRSLLGYPDSNQEKQDQNLLCYHYTISHCVLLLIFGCKDTASLNTDKTFEGEFSDFFEKSFSGRVNKQVQY